MELLELFMKLSYYFFIACVIPLSILGLIQFKICKKYNNKTSLLSTLPLSFFFTITYLFALSYEFQFSFVFFLIIEGALLVLYLTIRTVEENVELRMEEEHMKKL